MRACPATLLIVAVLCGGMVPIAAAAKPSATAMAPSFEELMNLKYSGLASGAVTLADGRYQDAATRRSVTLARSFRVTGDLDGDGGDEAVVLLAESSGGSGSFGYLVVVGRKGGVAMPRAIALLGDRVQLRGARIAGRRLVADVVRAGAHDALCCPGELATVAWELRGGKLQSVPTGVTPARLSLAVLAGAEWVLRDWAWNEPVPAGIEITLEADGDRLAGRGGCNRWFASAHAGDTPGDVAIGEAGATRMACPDPQMAAETRFLARLGAVRKYSFVDGQLALGWSEGDTMGTMLFERRLRKPKP
jgi:heat shock protein HslJ